MSDNSEQLAEILSKMAVLLETNESPDPELYAFFVKEPQLAFPLVDFINALDEAAEDEEEDQDNLSLYSAAIFAIELSVAQLKSSADNYHKASAKLLDQLMDHMAKIINSQRHSISFWLPVLNAFYEANIELTDALKNAYLDLAAHEQQNLITDEYSHMEAIKKLLEELSDLSDFDVAENFFSQSYAMPAEFFADLVLDLLDLKEGQDVAILALLHPDEQVREMVFAALDHVIDDLELSSISLSRLRVIKLWYPSHYQPSFDRWIKSQRKKGVVYLAPQPMPELSMKASEVDGSGAQGIFIQCERRLCGMLVQFEEGIKDAWMTPVISVDEIKRYYKDAFDGSVTLRAVDLDYLNLVIGHCLAQSAINGKVPNLHFLEIQELLGLEFEANPIDIPELITKLGVEINPFTEEVMEASLKRSKSWLKTKAFTESWFEENPQIDKLVNRHCSITNGTKVCNFHKAMALVFEENFELHRDKWLFHFLWLSLWLKSSTRKNEKTWIDSYFIAYAIYEHIPLRQIPVMNEICFQTVMNSVETMQERRSHLGPVIK